MARKDLTICGIFFLLPFLFLSGTLSSSQTFFMRDLTYLFHPWRTLAAQFIQSGEMPLWNSFQMGGMPFHANGQSAVLYPGTLLFFIWGFVPALKIFHGFHYGLASTGFFMLARKLGFPRAASFAVAVLWAYNGYLLTRLEFLSVAGCMIWLPWSLLFVSDIGRSPFLSLAGFAVSFLFSFLSGFPQIFLMQAVFVSAFCFVRNPPAASAKALAAGFLILLFLSAPLWVPMTELWGHSVRSGAGINAEDASMYSLPARGIPGLVSPLFMSIHKDQFTGEKYFWIWSAWWGFAGTFLILASLARVKKKLFWFSGTFFVLGILWAMGGYIPWFRYPPVALYWTVAAVCLLALLGFRALGKSPLLALLAAGILILELQAYSRQIHATIHSSYYQAAFANVMAVQMDQPGLVLLSPKVEVTRRLPGVTSAAAAMKFRAFLFDLTNLPYRIRTMNPSGEPLALNSYKNLWNRFHGHFFDELAADMNWLNLTHFLTEDDPGPGWDLVSGDEGLKVYRNSGAAGEIFAMDKSGKVLPASLRIENDRYEAAFNLPGKAILITHIPKYPGWKIFCREHGEHESGGRPPDILKDFLSAEIEPGEHHLHIIFDSNAWKLGVSLFLPGLSALWFLLL